MISIITVNLNNIQGLERTMRSVLSQTSLDFEWIVIDGGSTDGSKELIKEHADFISYWVSESDSGIYEAMNKGINASKGDYLQFLNSGDILADDNIVSDFNNQNFQKDVVYGNALIVDHEGIEVGFFNAPLEIRMSFFFNHALNHQATFFSKRCFERYRYNEQNKIASDLELYMLLLYKNFSFQKYNRTIVCFDNTGISSINTGENEFKGIVERILPKGIRADYEDFISFRDVDLAIMIKQIIKSHRIVRHITRLFLYPLYWISKKC